MKKTAMSMALLSALGMGASVGALADSFSPQSIETAATGGATTGGVGSDAVNGPSSSYNADFSNSANANFNDVANDVNTDNLTQITKDGVVIHAQRADQALATSDLNATVAGNMLLQDSVGSVGGQAGGVNTLGAVNRRETNDISGSFSGAAGIAVVSQSTGNMGSLQQSTVVQSNLKLN